MSQQQIFPNSEMDAMYSREVFPVSRSAKPGQDEARTMSATYFLKCSELLAKCDRAGLLVKTFTACLISSPGLRSSRFALVWNTRATKSGRLLCQLSRLGHPIKETESFLLPTPKTFDGIAETAGSGKTLIQRENGTFTNVDRNGVTWGPSLNDVARANLLPTPCARDYHNSHKKETLEAKGRGPTNSLPDAFAQTGKSSQLNTRFVAEMMGFPPDWTELPFLNGENKH